MQQTKLSRIHFSKQPLLKLRDADMRGDYIYDKPPGLWWSVNGDWERWCEHEQWDKPHEKIAYRVQIASARILRLRTERQVLKFTKDFCFQGDTRMIAWPAIASVYDGIEIPKYFWDIRHDKRCRWYYSWDCASGVAWNASRLKVSLVDLRKPTCA